MLYQITPFILTLNEEMNIGRFSEQLRWAHIVVVLDSGSKDKTVSIYAQFRNVQFVTLEFKDHA
jgi:glycosyltransferase involved in cell wall biosynthesis